MNGHAAICRRLLETGLPLNNLGHRQLQSIGVRYFARVRRGALKCFSSTKYPQNPLRQAEILYLCPLASQCGYVDIVVLLLKRGASVCLIVTANTLCT